MLLIRIIYKIIENFKKLDKTVIQIIVLLIISISLFLATVILKNRLLDKKFEWDYDKIISASDVVSEGTEIKNRELYWNLKDIIYQFLITNEDEEFEAVSNELNEATYMDYYKVLSKKYKKHLSKSEYEEKAIIFINKFMGEDHLGYKYVKEFIINNIYDYDDGKYLCVLTEKESNNMGYIGIEINEKMTEFSIFYIE